MSVAFGTIQTASKTTGGGAQTLTITKPTSTASGDLLIAVIGAEGNANNATLSGWTLIAGDADGTNARITVLAKQAGGSEPASYVFNGGSSSSGHALLGYVMRLTGTFSGTDNVTDKNTSVQATPATGHTFPKTINTTATTDLIIQGCLAYGGLPTQSTYAIATNNPTWTERADFNQDSTGTQDAGLSGATATVSTAGNTGNWSLTLSTSLAAIGYIINVADTANVTVTGTIGTITMVGNDGAISADANLTGTTGTFSLTGNDGAVTTPVSKWTNQSKNSTSVTNEPKS